MSVQDNAEFKTMQGVEKVAIRSNGRQLTISRRRSDCEVSMVSSNIPDATSEWSEANVKMLDKNTAHLKDGQLASAKDALLPNLPTPTVLGLTCRYPTRIGQ